MSKVSLPGPAPLTPEEKELQGLQTDLLKEQTGILKEQFRLQNLLAPTLFANAGLEPITDETGRITGFKQSALGAKRLGIEEQFLARSEAALKGELPVDPALTRELNLGERTLGESLRQQLGPGYETSSPGIEALNVASERRQRILEGARRGDLTLSEQLGLARESAVAGGTQGGLLPIQQNLTVAGLFGQTAGGFGSAFGGLSQRNLQSQRLGLDTNIANQQAQTALLSSIFGAVGTGVGIAGGAYLRK